MPSARKRDVSASYEAAERPETVASQLASHRKRPLEVAIFIAGGTDKYQWPAHALTNILVYRSCSEVAYGLCRPIGCLMMAWANRKVELAQLRIVSSALRINKSKNLINVDSLFTCR